MHAIQKKIKLSYVHGLKSIVLEELKEHGFSVVEEGEDAVSIPFSRESIVQVKKLRSVSRAYLVVQSPQYHPSYIFRHKSIIANLLEEILDFDEFTTFKISCAGSDSPEIRGIAAYLYEHFKLREDDPADLKLHIIKLNDFWELGIQVGARPLSLRDYKREHMSGAMDPSIAYALNHVSKLDSAQSYLNIFSGSGTLLIEAAQASDQISKLVGFDNNKKHLTMAIKNIKAAGLIRRIELKEADIFDQPDFGTFDIIVSDLPFGMSILEKDELPRLYAYFLKYCEDVLNPGGRLVVYTSEHKLFEELLHDSPFEVIQSLSLKFITNVDAYLRPKIFVCELEKDSSS